MSEVTYFQKYSQRENHITNNTLLMFRHLYQYNSSRLEKLLRAAIGEENLDIGLVFEQQVRANKSVPDGVISQKPFHIYIEAKVTGKLDFDQIKRHLESAKDNERSYIIGLTKDKISEVDFEQCKMSCKNEGVAFSAVTYSEVVELLRGQAREYDSDLIEIIDDYEQFLRSEKMISSPFVMLSFPCGVSIQENVDYQVYYEPSNRPDKSNVPYIGIYNNKKVTHFASIKKSICARYEDNELIIESDDKNLKDSEKERVVGIITASKYYPDLGHDSHRYYLFDDIQEVNIEKTSPYGLQGKKYFDLKADFSAEIRTGMNNFEIADLIRGKTFE